MSEDSTHLEFKIGYLYTLRIPVGICLLQPDIFLYRASEISDYARRRIENHRHSFAPLEAIKVIGSFTFTAPPQLDIAASISLATTVQLTEEEIAKMRTYIALVLRGAMKHFGY